MVAIARFMRMRGKVFEIARIMTPWNPYDKS